MRKVVRGKENLIVTLKGGSGLFRASILENGKFALEEFREDGQYLQLKNNFIITSGDTIDTLAQFEVEVSEHS